MRTGYKVINALTILYSIIMLISDVYYVVHNEDNTAGNMLVLGENAIFIAAMLLPLLCLLTIRFVIGLLCESKGIVLSNKDKPAGKTTFSKKWCAIVLPLLFVIAIAVILTVQQRMMYLPSYDSESYDYLTSADLEHEHLEEIEIVTEKGIYHGWGHKISADYPTVIYFGGNAQSSENFFANMEHSSGWVYTETCNAIMIDYPGYGSSEGTPEYKDILYMADMVYQYVSENPEYGNQEIVVMGYSLGTGVATYVASKHDVAGLILVAPYNNGLSLYNNICNIFHGPLKLLVRNPFPSDEFAKDVTVPVLIVASKDDEIVPYELSYQLQDAFGENELVTVDGLRHDQLFSDRTVLEAIRNYLEKYKK